MPISSWIIIHRRYCVIMHYQRKRVSRLWPTRRILRVKKTIVKNIHDSPYANIVPTGAIVDFYIHFGSDRVLFARFFLYSPSWLLGKHIINFFHILLSIFNDVPLSTFFNHFDTLIVHSSVRFFCLPPPTPPLRFFWFQFPCSFRSFQRLSSSFFIQIHKKLK